MDKFKDQILRIKQKLIDAKTTDSSYKVFGAVSHQYNIGDIVTLETITAFENDYNISLPKCYKYFLTIIGNSNGNNDHKRNFNHSNQNSAAGPFYGIYPFATNLDEIVENPKGYLCKDVAIFPNITDEEWDEFTEDGFKKNIPDDEYNKWLGNLFAGILPIGSQGCTYIHGLILNGKHKGKVVNLDISIQKPHFCYEDNFLDWYERWLNEIISGDLILQNAESFGYTKGGTENDLIAEYRNSNNDQQNICLSGLLKKNKISKESYTFIEQEYLKTSTNSNNYLLLHILTKFNYKKAYNYLVEYGKIDLLTVFQALHWYAKEQSSHWTGFIEKNICKINDNETFDFCCYILSNSTLDYGRILIPFTKHQNKEIRATAYYNLGELDTRSNYIEYFIIGLEDKSNRVVHTTLQALEEIKDFRLLKYYKNISERYPKETDYILCNLKLRLKEFSLSLKKIRSLSYEDIEIIINNKANTKWYKFWK